MKAWTDYPILQLGDTAGKIAPIRGCEVVSFDGDKYCKIIVDNVFAEVKCGYLYATTGRCGEVPTIKVKEQENETS